MACRGQPEQVAIVPVPEASVHKDSRSVPAQYKIWLSRKAAVMKPETKPELVQSGSDEHFRSRIAPPYLAHHPASGGGVNNVRQLDCPICDLLRCSKSGRLIEALA